MLTVNFKNQFKDKLIYDSIVFDNIDENVKLHEETKGNPLSSAAACLNVLGSMMNNQIELLCFLNHFDLEIEELIEFPSNCIVGDSLYTDKGYVVFEWVGPQISPINEKGGGRGNYRTSIDAFIIAKIKRKITQLLIEWKFTEGKSRPLALERFAGSKGLERLNRYANILVSMRGKSDFPFNFSEEKGLGLYDLSADHLYQLLRMTLLVKTTTPIEIGGLKIEDYRIVHMSHSQNNDIEILHDKYLESCPGLKKYAGMKMYDVGYDILSPYDKEKFKSGHWDKAIGNIKNVELRDYLKKRY